MFWKCIYGGVTHFYKWVYKWKRSNRKSKSPAFRNTIKVEFRISHKNYCHLTLPKECLMRPDHMSLIILWEMQGFLANNTSEVLCQIVLTWQNRTYQKCWICKSFFLLLLRLQDFPNLPLLTVCLFYLTLSHILQTPSSM